MNATRVISNLKEFTFNYPDLDCIKLFVPVYTEHQCCDNAAMMLAILLSLKTMESLLFGVNWPLDVVLDG